MSAQSILATLLATAFVTASPLYAEEPVKDKEKAAVTEEAPPEPEEPAIVTEDDIRMMCQAKDRRKDSNSFNTCMRRNKRDIGKVVTPEIETKLDQADKKIIKRTGKSARPPRPSDTSE